MTPNSLDLCGELCAVTMGGTLIAWFGVFRGTYCYCATSFHSTYSTTCDIPCPGNSEQICGGTFGISIYELSNSCVRPPNLVSPTAEPTPELCSTPAPSPIVPGENCNPEQALRQIGPANNSGIDLQSYTYSGEFPYLGGPVTWVDTDHYGMFVGGCFLNVTTNLYNVAGFWPPAPEPEWLPAGNGLNNCVYTLAYYPGRHILYAGGLFIETALDSVSTPYIAQANLSHNETTVQVLWGPVPTSNLTSYVFELYFDVHNSLLHVGGYLQASAIVVGSPYGGENLGYQIYNPLIPEFFQPTNYAAENAEVYALAQSKNDRRKQKKKPLCCYFCFCYFLSDKKVPPK